FSEVRRASRLVLPGARISGCGAFDEWRCGSGGECLPCRPRPQSAQSKVALWSRRSAQGARQGLRRWICPEAVRSFMERRRHVAENGRPGLEAINSGDPDEIETIGVECDRHLPATGANIPRCGSALLPCAGSGKPGGETYIEPGSSFAHLYGYFSLWSKISSLHP